MTMIYQIMIKAHRQMRHCQFFPSFFFFRPEINLPNFSWQFSFHVVNQSNHRQFDAISWQFVWFFIICPLFCQFLMDFHEKNNPFLPKSVGRVLVHPTIKTLLIIISLFGQRWPAIFLFGIFSSMIFHWIRL